MMALTTLQAPERCCLWYDCNIIAQAMNPLNKGVPMSIRAHPRGGNARRLVDSILLAFLRPFPRSRDARAEFVFAIVRVAAPIGLVAALLIVAAPGQPDAAVASAPAPVPEASRLR
ncbi:MAG: hypothetical protein EHM83_10275 [Burkholderiales bacterium]|nr:MAG: hypothetical protein EHM83_10275 [Burkholderiales bacterium]